MSDRPKTLRELRESGYRSTPVKHELRRNLLTKLRNKQPLFPGILGYEETVIPQIQNAILSQHDILFLGLRGQGKTRMLRMLTTLLDDAIPIVAGSEIHDDPLAPLSKFARDLIASQGDQTPIEWIGRDDRYHEKLATPDVTIADLIGEVDLVKHAEGRHLSSEDVLHFGLIPRSHRGIFCMNELPDLSPKIQVGLFNVLEERDVQIRGFPIRLNLDVCMVFSANPEDYTNRGRIVTPLKDRIGSVVRTHYPETVDEGIQIAAQLRRERPRCGVVVLSQHAEAAYALALLQGGSAGRAYLLKEHVSDLDELLVAVREVASGGSRIDPQVVEQLVAGTRNARGSELDRLTPRETEVLSEMARGKSNSAIAASLVLSERAVEKHTNSIFSKLGLSEERDLNRRVKAVLMYLHEQQDG